MNTPGRVASATEVTIANDLTLWNAFRFPIQHATARREVLWGALLFLLLPGIGWVLNMGHRIQMVHRMHAGLSPWPAWYGYPKLFLLGFVATLAIASYLLPAVAVLALYWWTGQRLLLIPAVILWFLGIFIIPGFMTFYCKAYDLREILDPRRSVRRAFQAGRPYLHAWAIGLTAVSVSFLGFLALGVGFAVTSVWFWQVAGFCHANVFSNQCSLIDVETAQENGTDSDTSQSPIPTCSERPSQRTHT